MSESLEPIETVPDEPAEGTSTSRRRLLPLVTLVLVCAVIELGTWQLVVLHNEVSSLQTQNQNHSQLARIQKQLDGVTSLAEQAPTGGQYNQLLTQVRALQSQVNGVAAVGTSGFYASQSDVINLSNTVSGLRTMLSDLQSTVSGLQSRCRAFSVATSRAESAEGVVRNALVWRGDGDAAVATLKDTGTHGAGIVTACSRRRSTGHVPRRSDDLPV